MYGRSYVQKYINRRFYIHDIQKVLCSEGSMFRRLWKNKFLS